MIVVVYYTVFIRIEAGLINARALVNIGVQHSKGNKHLREMQKGLI